MEKEDLPPISEKLNYNPKDVFISWNHRDRNYLEAILDIFSSTKDSQEGEITTWNSEFGGDCVGDLGYVISHNIPLCKAFLLILSPNCLKSEWTLREYLTAAKDPRIGINHILPVIVSPLDYDNLDKWNPELYKDNPKDYALIKTFVERLNKETASMFSFSHYINKDKESLIEKMREILLNRAMVDIHNVKETFSVKKFYPELSFNDDLSDLYIKRSLTEIETGYSLEEDEFINKIRDEEGGRYLILASAGIGKTEFLKDIKNNLNKAFDHSAFLISCRKLAESHKNIFDYLYETLTERLSLRFSVNRLEAIFYKRKVTILLDAFDEIIDNSSKPAFFEGIDNLLKAYPNINIIVSSRYAPSTLKERFAFKEYNLKGFDEDNIKTYAKGLFLKIEGSGEDDFQPFYLQVETIEKEVKENPLFLSQLVCIYRLDKDILKTKVEILRRMSSHLLDIDIENGLESKERSVDAEVLEDLLPYLAYYSTIGHKKGDLFYIFLKDNASKYGLQSSTKEARRLREYLDNRSLTINGEMSLKIFLDYYCALYLYQNLYDERLGEFIDDGAFEKLLKENDGNYPLCQMLLCLLDNRLDEDDYPLSIQKLFRISSDYVPYFETLPLIRESELTSSILLETLIQKTMEGEFYYYGDIFFYVSKYYLYEEVLKVGFPLIEDYGLKLLSLIRDICYILEDYTEIEEITEDYDLIKAYQDAVIHFGESYRNALNALFYEVEVPWIDKQITEKNKSIFPFFWNLSLIKNGKFFTRMGNKGHVEIYDDELKMFDRDKPSSKGLLFLFPRDGDFLKPSLIDEGKITGLIIEALNLEGSSYIDGLSGFLLSLGERNLKVIDIHVNIEGKKERRLPFVFSFTKGKDNGGYALYLEGVGFLKGVDLDHTYLNELFISSNIVMEDCLAFRGPAIKEASLRWISINENHYESKGINLCNLQRTIHEIGRKNEGMEDPYEGLFLYGLPFDVGVYDSIRLFRKGNVRYLLVRKENEGYFAYPFAFDYRSETIEVPPFLIYKKQEYKIGPFVRSYEYSSKRSEILSFMARRKIDTPLRHLVVPGSFSPFYPSAFLHFPYLESIKIEEGTKEIIFDNPRDSIDLLMDNPEFIVPKKIYVPRSATSLEIDFSTPLIYTQEDKYACKAFEIIVEGDLPAFKGSCLSEVEEESQPIYAVIHNGKDITAEIIDGILGKLAEDPGNIDVESIKSSNAEFLYKEVDLGNRISGQFVLLEARGNIDKAFYLKEELNEAFDYIKNVVHGSKANDYEVIINNESKIDKGLVILDFSSIIKTSFLSFSIGGFPVLKTIYLPSYISYGDLPISSCPSLEKVMLRNEAIPNAHSAYLSIAKDYLNEYEGGLYLGNEDNPYFVLAGFKEGYFHKTVKIHPDVIYVSIPHHLRDFAPLRVYIPSINFNNEMKEVFFSLLTPAYELFFEEGSPLYQEYLHYRPFRNGMPVDLTKKKRQIVHPSFAEEKEAYCNKDFIITRDGTLLWMNQDEFNYDLRIPKAIETEIGEITIKRIDDLAFSEFDFEYVASINIEAEIESIDGYYIYSSHNLVSLILPSSLKKIEGEMDLPRNIEFISIPSTLEFHIDKQKHPYVYIDRREKGAEINIPYKEENGIRYLLDKGTMVLSFAFIDEDSKELVLPKKENGINRRVIFSISSDADDEFIFRLPNDIETLIYYDGDLEYLDFDRIIVPENNKTTLLFVEADIYCITYEDGMINPHVLDYGYAKDKVNFVREVEIIDKKGNIDRPETLFVNEKNIDDYLYIRFGIAQFKKIQIGQNVFSIGDHCFDDITRVEEVIIEEGVNRIGASFNGLGHLRFIDLPSSLISLSSAAFRESHSLERVICPKRFEDHFDDYEPISKNELEDGRIELRFQR